MLQMWQGSWFRPGRRRGRSSWSVVLAAVMIAATGLSSCTHHKNATGAPSQFGARPLMSLAADRPLPANAVANVKTEFGAKGDGQTDDTAAIQQAITATIGYQHQNDKKILYFPNGTYLVSDRLVWKNAAGTWDTYLTLQGQSRTGTVIRLKDGAAGYSDPSSPKAVIYTASLGASATSTTVDGSGNRAHNNFILDLTVDTGSGNTGAVGIDYMANNLGAIRDVVIRSGDGAGVTGLSMQRYGPGPCMISDLEVIGFDTGIAAARLDYSVTFEHITLRRQRVSGITDEDNVLSIRSLESVNRVPAVTLRSHYSTPNALVTLQDGNLVGGDPSQNAVGGIGNLFLRNVSAGGYRSVVSRNGVTVPGLTLAEYSSNGYRTPFAGPAQSVNLPVADEPMFTDGNMGDWADVTAFGAVPSDNKDDTAGIQAAIDSGKPVVYLPTGTYQVSKTIVVHGPLRELLGFESILTVNSKAKAAFSGPPARPLLRVEAGGGQPVFIKQLQMGTYGDEPAIEDAGPSALVIQDDHLPAIAYRNVKSAGPLYIDDVDGGAWTFDHQQVWARQLNTEATGVKLTNTGGQLWVLGIKTEAPSTVAVTSDGGTTEVLGGLLYPVNNVDPATPAFIGRDSNLMLVYSTTAYVAGRSYATQVSDTRGSDVRGLQTAGLPERGLGSTTPPYVSVSRPDLLPGHRAG